MSVFFIKGGSGGAGASELKVGTLENLNREALPAFKGRDHEFEVGVGEGDDAASLAGPKINGVLVSGPGKGIASDQDAEPSEFVIEVAVELVDVIALNLPDILHFEDELATVVTVKNFLEEVER